MNIDMNTSVSTLQGIQSLADLSGERGLIIYFYPKDMTPGCTKQACDLVDPYMLLQNLGWGLVGVSQDSLEKHAQFSERYALPFPLIADLEHVLADAFGVWVEKSMFGRRYYGMERSTFVLSPEGAVLRSWRKVSPLKHRALVLDYVRTLV